MHMGIQDQKGITLVPKVFQQIHGINYDETFCLVKKLDSIRLALSIGVARGWKVHYIDVNNYFIHRDIS